jgi:hypothetical protein
VTPEPGSVVVWIRDGRPEYGLLEGAQGNQLWVRRLDGPAHTHARRFPKSDDELVPIATPAELAAWLTERARQALAQAPS